MLDKQKIVEAFKNMDFGKAVHNTKLANDWLERRQVNLDTQHLQNIEITLQSENTASLDDVFTRQNFFKEITDEIKENEELIANLEMVVRGFSYKDSIKSINLFLDYLSHGSSNDWVSAGDELIRLPNEAIPLSYVGAIMTNSNLPRLILVVRFKLFVILSAIKDIIHEQCKKYNFAFALDVYPVNHILAGGHAEDIESIFSGRTPVLIFNGADLESACDSVINAAYAEQGLMPWSVNSVFVQENIYDEVILKLKKRLDGIQLGGSVHKQVDFSVPFLMGDNEAEFAEILAHAKSKGIDVYQPEGSKLRALFIGGKVYSNSALSPNSPKVPYVNVMAFRSIEEAIALANNQQQTFATSVWANDVGLVHEIIHSLNVDTVWINTHGIFHPIALLPMRRCHVKKSDWQVVWAKKTENERIEILQGIGMTLASKFEGKSLGRTLARQMVTVKSYKGNCNVLIHGSCELKQFQFTNRFISIYHDGNFESTFAHALQALVAGNEVMVNMQDKLTDEIMVLKKEIDLITSNLPFSIVNSKFCQYQAMFKNVWTAIGENYV